MARVHAVHGMSHSATDVAELAVVVATGCGLQQQEHWRNGQALAWLGIHCCSADAQSDAGSHSLPHVRATHTGCSEHWEGELTKHPVERAEGVPAVEDDACMQGGAN